MILETSGKLFHNAGPFLHLPQQQTATVGTDVSTVELTAYSREPKA